MYISDGLLGCDAVWFVRYQYFRRICSSVLGPISPPIYKTELCHCHENIISQGRTQHIVQDAGKQTCCFWQVVMYSFISLFVAHNEI